MALTAGFLYGLSFLTVVPTFYRCGRQSSRLHCTAPESRLLWASAARSCNLRPPLLCRDSSPLTPPTAAIGATLAMLAPLAAVLLGLAAAGGSPLLGVLYFSPRERGGGRACCSPLLQLSAGGASPRHASPPTPPSNAVRMLACLIATPLALWLPAVALCSWAPFREQHMPLPPAQRAAAADAPAAAEPAGLPSDKKED